MLIVMKFGGTSVGSPEALKQVSSIVAKTRERGDKVVVVVSAMSGVTDLLLTGAHAAEQGETSTANRSSQDILDRHKAVLDAFLSDTSSRDAMVAQMKALLFDFEAFCNSIKVLGELSPRALDVVASLGERMNVRQVAAVLESQGIPAKSVEATELIVTDDCFGSAKPKVPETADRSQSVLSPMLAEGIVPVVTGFVGANRDGILTTLGRGGSDYSATILGRALGADEVWIWTDVNGVMTTDPRLVPEAQTISQLSYAEVGEMAYFGAKVLHPQAIRPAKQTGIPVRILNTFEPDHPGTRITRETKSIDHAVKAITVIKGLSLVVLEGGGMLGVPGVAARTFGTVARTGVSVLMISQSSSEQSICFVVPTSEVTGIVSDLKTEFTRELERHDIESIDTQDHIVILAVVGAGMKGIPGIAARVFGALGREHINVIAISQGSSEYNISLVIAHGDAEDAVHTLHREFELGNQLDELE